MGASVQDLVADYKPRSTLTEALTPPSSWYREREVLDLELKTVFTSSWQTAARTDQLREPGKYTTHTISGEPILIVRGKDHALRGFYNVCRHHAAEVLTQCEGRIDNLRCPYHGWTYDLEGKLIHTPEFAGVENFHRDANGLVPVQTAEWQGWVFVKLDPGGSNFNEFFGADLVERLQPLNLERLHWFERRSYFLDCNWKVFVDNYLDGGYHVPHIHRGLGSVLDNSKYKIETGTRFCLQSSPIAADKGDALTAAVRQGSHAYYLWIYPNFMINIYEEVMDTNLVIPHGVDKTEVVFDYYFTDLSESARERNLMSIAVSEKIQAEDVTICESVQRGLNSRAYDTGRLSVRREAGEHLFHRLLHANLTAALPGAR